MSRLGVDFAIAIGLVIVTLLPLGLRASSVVMISIPLSLAIGLALLEFTGFSLNQLSIAGFVVALGLLVDDSIVVVENIARHLRMGYDRAHAAVAATDQIALAVLGCTATLMFAFLPLLFLPGGPGTFIRSLPAAVLYTIGASLVVALTIIPFLASALLSRESHASEGNAALRALTAGIRRVYGPALQRALAWPRTTLLAGLAIFVGSLGLVPLIGFSLFPSADTPQFLIEIETAEGASLAETDRALRFVEEELGRRAEVKHWFANLGRGNPLIYYNVTPRETRANVAEVFTELKEFDPHTSPALLDELRAVFDQYPAARITLKEFENGPPIAAPIAIRVTGPELARLRELASEVEALMRATEGARDVHNPVRLLRTDLDLGIDTDKAALPRRAARGSGSHGAPRGRGARREPLPRGRRRRVRHHDSAAAGRPADARGARPDPDRHGGRRQAAASSDRRSQVPHGAAGDSTPRSRAASDLDGLHRDGSQHRPRDTGDPGPSSSNSIGRTAMDSQSAARPRREPRASRASAARCSLPYSASSRCSCSSSAASARC